MCGLAGIVLPTGRRVERSLLEPMAEAIRSRGPDAGGFFERENFGLAHRRLKIIDLSDAANQPMLTDDGQVALVFNGEVYNFLELRAELEHGGHRFRTRSDTEVVLRAFLAWGPGCFARFNGMFAVALFDFREGRRALHLARDRFGVKPLFYWHSGETLAFASTLAPLLRLPGAPRETNPDVALSFLKLGHVPAPHTAVRGTRQLRPGESLTFSGGELRSSRFAPPPFREGRPAVTDGNEALHGVWTRLCASVKRQAVADVPVGCFVSGGIDSTLILAAHAAVGGAPLDTFSVGYEEASFDERGPARVVAELFGTRHHEFQMRPSDLLALIREGALVTDQPFADPTLGPTQALAKATREHVTVCFSGDGGDELFFGYLHEKLLLLVHQLNVLPGGARRALFRGLELALATLNAAARNPRVAQLVKLTQILQFENDVEKYLYFLGMIGPLPFARLRSLVPGARLANEEEIRALVEKTAPLTEPARIATIFLQTFLVDTVLTKTDRASMAHGLECRVPFLDNELADYTFALAPGLHGGAFGPSKSLLRRLLRLRLPPGKAEEIAGRKKQGFSIPMRDWLRGELRGLLQETLAPERIRAGGLFDPAGVQRLVDEHLAKVQNHSHLLWSLICFEQWKARHQL